MLPKDGQIEWLVSEIRSLRAEIRADRVQLARLKRLLGLETLTLVNPERADDPASPLH
jgi:hypothetical protein